MHVRSVVASLVLVNFKFPTLLITQEKTLRLLFYYVQAVYAHAKVLAYTATQEYACGASFLQISVKIPDYATFAPDFMKKPAKAIAFAWVLREFSARGVIAFAGQ